MRNLTPLRAVTDVTAGGVTVPVICTSSAVEGGASTGWVDVRAIEDTGSVGGPGGGAGRTRKPGGDDVPDAIAGGADAELAPGEVVEMDVAVGRVVDEVPGRAVLERPVALVDPLVDELPLSADRVGDVLGDAAQFERSLAAVGHGGRIAQLPAAAGQAVDRPPAQAV